MKVRAAAVLVQEGKILLVEHEKGKERYWVLPGGKVQEGEEVRAAVAREVKEELGLQVRARNLLIIDEVIWPSGTRHDLDITFEVELLGGELAIETGTVVKGACLFPLKDLKKIDLRPSVGSVLLEILAEKGEGRGARYLGNIWKETGSCRL